eukprot:TRINITY_DN4019_c0_g5_i1.p1 TRINITY_DN4019_c0_g5~~TRINITY_DN4019_c0_g5_i1.p1  ORF type:complete len:177 (+),score=13.16 TRINITY_DN4019_c0_g5_i1:312-842(+)
MEPPPSWQSHSDPHRVLGVERGASVGEVKAAYRRLALKWHPDVNSGDAAAFKRITEAYGSLLHPQTSIPSTSSYPSGPPFRRRRSPPLMAGFGGTAKIVWTMGLALGCCLFGTALFLGNSDMYSHNVYRKGPSRMIYPTTDTEKRERIARLLMEKTRSEGKSGAVKDAAEANEKSS